jgi:hypothetical protein
MSIPSDAYECEQYLMHVHTLHDIHQSKFYRVSEALTSVQFILHQIFADVQEAVGSPLPLPGIVPSGGIQ